MPVVHPATIDWSADYCTQKRCNDIEIYKIMLHYFLGGRKKPKEISILSFPGDRWIFERNLSDTMKASKVPLIIDGLEKYKEVYDIALPKMKRLRKDYPFNTYSLVNKRALSFLKKTKNTYDVVYFDWMGTWTKEKRDEMTLLFSNNILKKGSLLIITALLGRGVGEAIDELDVLKDIEVTAFPFYMQKKDSWSDDNFARKTTGLANKVFLLAEQYGYNAEIAYWNQYPGVSKQYEMSFVFRIS